MQDGAPRPAIVRNLASTVYLPTVFFEIGIGAIYPILALSPVRMGASAALASAAVGAYALGRIAGSSFGGVLAARWGSPRAALAGMAWTTLATLVCAASTSVLPFIVGATLIGIGHALVHLSRQSQVVEIVPDHYRARGLTTLAGIWRIANFVGPLAGALVILQEGLRAAYVFAAASMLIGGIALLAARGRRSSAHAPQVRRVSPARVIRENRKVLGTLGVAVALTGAVRGARIVALPLWAAHLGLSDGTASAIFAVSAAVDMVLFLPAGVVMDKWGRRWIALPSTLLLGLGLLALPFTSGVTTLTVAAAILGLGNGWGSGLLMTLGFDVAPAEGRHVFMGLWMVLQDAGGLAGPAIVSLGALAPLPYGILAVGAIGVAAAGLLARWIPPWRLDEGARTDALG